MPEAKGVLGMAGFRLWEGVGIEDLLEHLYRAALDEVALKDKKEPPEGFKRRLKAALKHVLNTDMYASPVCGESSICSPSEEGRVRPWSRKAKEWGLVSGRVENV